MAKMHLLRVFVDPHGRYGNPLGVFLCGTDLQQNRQAVAADLGYSEIVFVDDSSRATVRIFSPEAELAFAGHPLVGTSWLLAHEGKEVSLLRPPAGDVPTWIENDFAWIRGRPEWAPPWDHVQLGKAEEINSMQPPSDYDFAQFWAWVDEQRNIVRARVFASRIGIEEDEACGSASMLLAHRLGRPITIQHGSGSVVEARPGPGGTVEVGGAVVLDRICESGLTQTDSVER